LRCLFQTKVGADFLIFKDVDNPAQHSAKGRKSSFKNYEICISAMTPVALFHLLFGTENDRSKRPIINCAPIIFLPLLLTGKVVDNQIFQYVYRQIHQIHTSIDLGSRFSIGSCWRPRCILIVADSVESARAPAVRFDP
jgi:hypothetical protein